MSPELLSLIAPAFVVGLIIALTHAPLGIEVLRRDIIFIDLAIAQIAGLGVVLATNMLHESTGVTVQLSALTLALMAAIFFRFTERKLPEQQEAIIGCGFIIAASLTILFLTNNPHSGEEIQHLLSGQILFTTWSDILWHSPIYIVILTIWFFIPKLKQKLGFYALFALAITSSVQLVGIYVVFASLILPALSAVNSNTPHKTAWICGIVSVTLGTILSTFLDLPAGPVIVCAYATTCIVIRLLPQRINA